MFGDGDGGTGAVCGVCSGLAVKTPERRQWCHAGTFIVDWGCGWRLVLVFLLLTVNADWVLVNLMTRFLLTNNISD